MQICWAAAINRLSFKEKLPILTNEAFTENWMVEIGPVHSECSFLDNHPIAHKQSFFWGSTIFQGVLLNLQNIFEASNYLVFQIFQIHSCILQYYGCRYSLSIRFSLSLFTSLSLSLSPLILFEIKLSFLFLRVTIPVSLSNHGWLLNRIWKCLWLTEIFYELKPLMYFIW